MNNIQPGEMIHFTYNVPAVTANDIPSTSAKDVFVLNNDNGIIHGIDLSMLTPADIEVLNAVMDPNNKGKIHRIPLVNDILRRMDPLIEIKNPVSFYAKFVKPFIRNKDAYRTYFLTRMANIIDTKKTNVHGNTVNPKPLFHKI